MTTGRRLFFPLSPLVKIFPEKFLTPPTHKTQPTEIQPLSTTLQSTQTTSTMMDAPAFDGMQPDGEGMGMDGSPSPAPLPPSGSRDPPTQAPTTLFLPTCSEVTEDKSGNKKKREITAFKEFSNEELAAMSALGTFNEKYICTKCDQRGFVKTNGRTRDTLRFKCHGIHHEKKCGKTFSAEAILRTAGLGSELSAEEAVSDTKKRRKAQGTAQDAVPAANIDHQVTNMREFVVQNLENLDQAQRHIAVLTQERDILQAQLRDLHAVQMSVFQENAGLKQELEQLRQDLANSRRTLFLPESIPQVTTFQPPQPNEGFKLRTSTTPQPQVPRAASTTEIFQTAQRQAPSLANQLQEALLRELQPTIPVTAPPKPKTKPPKQVSYAAVATTNVPAPTTTGQPSLLALRALRFSPIRPPPQAQDKRVVALYFRDLKRGPVGPLRRALQEAGVQTRYILDVAFVRRDTAEFIVLQEAVEDIQRTMKSAGFRRSDFTLQQRSGQNQDQERAQRFKTAYDNRTANISSRLPAGEIRDNFLQIRTLTSAPTDNEGFTKVVRGPKPPPSVTMPTVDESSAQTTPQAEQPTKKKEKKTKKAEVTTKPPATEGVPPQTEGETPMDTTDSL